MMGAACHLVSLRWALTWSALRKSVWQTIGYVIGVLLALGTVVCFAWLGWNLPSLVGGMATAFPLDGVWATRLCLVLGGSVVGVFAAVVQLTLVGEGTSISPDRFALYGIPDRELQAGVLLSGLCGVPALTGILSLALMALALRPLGPPVVAVGMVGAVLAVCAWVSISKMLLSLATTLVRSRKGQAAFYLAVVALVMVATQLPGMVMNGYGRSVSGMADDGTSAMSVVFDPAVLDSAVDICAWTPFGAALQLPFDVASGDWLPALGRCLELGATYVVCFAASTWCLRRIRLVGGGAVASRTAAGLGAFRWMPDSPAGAVAARLVVYWRRDPRYSMSLLLPVLFLVIFAVQAISTGTPGMIWSAPAVCGWLFSIVESNNLAYDGRAYAMHVLCGVRGRDDRLGRTLVAFGVAAVGTLLSCAVCMVVNASWSSADGLAVASVVSCCSLGLAASGFGLAQVLSCVLMYPVPAIDKPFSSPQGRALAQGLFPLAHMFGALALMMPTAVVLIVVAVVGSGIWWLPCATALVNGAAVLAVGVVLGGKLLEARGPRIISTLDGFAGLQK